jgi:hypothetical protein
MLIFLNTEKSKSLDKLKPAQAGFFYAYTFSDMKVFGRMSMLSNFDYIC